MLTQNYLSDQIERLISSMIKQGQLEIADYIACYSIKRCDECPLQGQNCELARKAYELKHYPELHI